MRIMSKLVRENGCGAGNHWDSWYILYAELGETDITQIDKRTKRKENRLK